MSNEDIRERLSALMDGELQPGEAARLLEQVADDPELRRVWARYHLMGDALRSELCCASSEPVAARVRGALAAEPAPARRVRQPPGALRPVAGLALAASVAALAIVGMGLVHEPEPPPRQAMTQAQNPLRWDVQEPAVEARLNAYLVNHSEYVEGGLPGLLPYARVVGYDEKP